MRLLLYTLLAGVAAALALAGSALAATERTLYGFVPYPPSSVQWTGAYPDGTLLRDASGALYGANLVGGIHNNGTIFKLTPPAPGQTRWTFTVLHTFTGGNDGGLPAPNLIMDASGAIYGTTESGGSYLNEGVVYKLTPPTPGTTTWKETVLHRFLWDGAYNTTDGANPDGGVIMDASGALYGTTDVGGSFDGYGTVFRLTPPGPGATAWRETILYRFAGGADGRNPLSALTQDAAGALYGLTLYGGTGPCEDGFYNVIGCGTAFKLTPPAPGQTRWTKTTLHRFTGGADGGEPQGKLLVDASGAVIGTTYLGGTGDCVAGLDDWIGCGVVFKLTPPAPGLTQWTETKIHDFQGPEGAFPQGGVIAGPDGRLYGTASGSSPDSYGVGGFGTVYELDPPAPGVPAWAATALHVFNISTTGEEPVGELVRDPSGRLFGVASNGSSAGAGAVFQVTP